MSGTELSVKKSKVNPAQVLPLSSCQPNAMMCVMSPGHFLGEHRLSWEPLRERERLTYHRNLSEVSSEMVPLSKSY